jgi:hypothetical protein
VNHNKPLCMKQWLTQVRELEKVLVQDSWGWKCGRKREASNQKTAAGNGVFVSEGAGKTRLVLSPL